MAIELVKVTKLDGWGTTLSVPHVSTAGNLLLVHVSVGNVLTPTDTAGNAWALVADTATVGATAQRLGQIYACLDADAITALTLTHAANQNFVVLVSEWSGVQSLRGAALNTGTSSAATVPALAGDTVLAGCFYYKATGSTPAPAPTGWTDVDTAIRGNNFNSLAYSTVEANGAAGPSWGQGTNGAQWVVALEPVPVAPAFLWTGTQWVPQVIELVA